MNRRLLLFVLAGLFGAGAGWLAKSQWHELRADSARREVTAGPEELVGRQRPDFTIGSSDGARVSVTEFDGQVMLINFWATWCAPCRAEMPMLSEIHDQYVNEGFTVVGIALDDVAQAREFAAELGIAYPVLVGGADVMAAGKAYGNRAGLLPYSVLVDRQGIVRWAYLGELERDELLTRIRALL